jgi:plasmid rolling circle replication initiator protein Rep
MKSKAQDKYERIYKNQSKAMRADLLLDYEQIAKNPHDRIGRHMVKSGWSPEDIDEMVELLREGLR